MIAVTPEYLKKEYEKVSGTQEEESLLDEAYYIFAKTLATEKPENIIPLLEQLGDNNLRDDALQGLMAIVSTEKGRHIARLRPVIEQAKRQFKLH